METLLYYIVLLYLISPSTCLSSSLILEFLSPFPQLFDFLGVIVVKDTVQRSSPYKCGQESCCNAFNAVVAVFSSDISAFLFLVLLIWSLSLSLEFLGKLYKSRWSWIDRHLSGLRSSTFSDHYLSTFICTTPYYGALRKAFSSSNVLLLVNGAFSPTQKLKFWPLQQYIYSLKTFKNDNKYHHFPIINNWVFLRNLKKKEKRKRKKKKKITKGLYH